MKNHVVVTALRPKHVASGNFLISFVKLNILSLSLYHKAGHAKSVQNIPAKYRRPCCNPARADTLPRCPVFLWRMLVLRYNVCVLSVERDTGEEILTVIGK